MEHRQAAADPVQALLKIRDPHGRLCGLGFLADRQGTVVTAYETVAGMPRVVLHTLGGQSRVLGPESIDLLPEYGLALLRTDGVGGVPGAVLAVADDAGARLVAVPHQRWEDGAPVLVQGGVLGRAAALYAVGDALPVVEGVLVLELAGTPLAGAPVLDAETGAVLGVVTHGVTGAPGAAAAGTVRAVPLPRHPGGPLGAVLERNAVAVPAYGRALNLGGVLQLASVQLGNAVAGPGRIVDLAADRVDRADGLVGEEPQQPLTVLLGEAGSGRSTELAALTVRRAGGAQPLPTLWLRGADLAAGDRSLADTVGRALRLTAGLLDVPVPDAEAVARLCRAAGRPLLVVLDGPEEAPPALSDDWLRASSRWLEESGVRLLVACRPDGWEALRAWWEGARLHWLGELPPDAAARAARRYGLPDGCLADARPEDPGDGGADGERDGAAEGRTAGGAGVGGRGRHPLVLRIAGELWAEGVQGPLPARGELFAGWLDLCCLRVARRVLAASGVRRPGAHRRGGPAPAGEDAGQLRRLAAAVAGRVHDAARLMLGAGHGGLTAAEFTELFPAAGGWGRAVLDERLFVAVGDGYRPAYEDWADWLQGLHLDLDGALRLLLAEGEAAGAAQTPPGRDDGAGPGGDGAEGAAEAEAGPGPGPEAGPAAAPAEPAAGGVPRARVGVVVAALARVAEVRGAGALDVWLHRIRLALDAAHPGGEVDWWAGRLLAAVLPLSPDPAVHRALLGLLAERAGRDARFGPPFWAALALTPRERLELLRVLVRVDGPEGAFQGVTAGLLAGDPGAAMPLLCHWFDDPEEAVADLAADLLYAHRALALDELTEALVTAGHPRADRLLGRLAAEEPSTLCRAVDRWSHDPRPERHVAAAVHALRTVPYASDSGRGLLRHAARTLLAREDEPGVHGAALALLVRDAATRGEHLAAALAAYRAGDPFLTDEVLAAALPDHPDDVLAAVRDRLTAPGAPVAEGLRVLGTAADPDVVRRGALLAADLLREHPERAGQIAAHLDGLLARGQDARPLLAEALTAAPPVRQAFAEVLAAPDERPVRGRLLDTLLAAERDPAVLTAVLETLAARWAEHDPARLRELFRRIAGRWDGADAVLVRCAGRAAGFARLLADWPGDGPPPPDGPRLARMRALTGQGRDPQYAAAEAERGSRPGEERRTGHTGTIPVPRQGRAHGTL